MRHLLFSLSIVVVGHFAAQANAQATVSAVFIPEEGIDNREATFAAIGVRRGVNEVSGVRFVHPVDVLTTRTTSPELLDALDELEPLADMVRSGDPRAAARRLEAVLRLMEDNLDTVSRSQLVDARMLTAVAHCRMGRDRRCERELASIVTFREAFQYDSERYGESERARFERVRLRTLSGQRGSLEVHTEPEGAEVFVDGRSYGPAPVTVPGLLTGGHYVTLKQIGYEREIFETNVREGDANRVRRVLDASPRARLVNDPRVFENVRFELGEPRAGTSIGSLGSTLRTTQVLLGRISSAEVSGQIRLRLYLYHMHTRLLQAQTELTTTADQAGVEAIRVAANTLYEGVDLDGGVEAPDDADPLADYEPPPEAHEQWWFWLAVLGGAALVAGGVTAGILLNDQESPVPAGFSRVVVAF